MSLIAPPPRTSSLVVDRMHQLIADGDWPVGSRIPAEPELVALFGVGRNTIREAVRALEHAGLLAPRRGDGTYVRSANVLTEAIARCTNESELMDLLTTRRALESEAAALAADSITATDLEGLRELLATADAALSSGDVDRYAVADVAFHHALVAASGNRLLISLYEGVGEVIARHHAALVAASVRDRRNPAGHAEIIDAIASGDRLRARDAVYSYVDDAIAGLQ